MYPLVFFVMIFPHIAIAEVIFDSDDARIVVECIAGTCVYTDVGSGTHMTCEQAEKRLAAVQARKKVLMMQLQGGGINDSGMREMCMIDGEAQVLHAIVHHDGCIHRPHNNKGTPPRKKRGKYYVAGL